MILLHGGVTHHCAAAAAARARRAAAAAAARRATAAAAARRGSAPPPPPPPPPALPPVDAIPRARATIKPFGAFVAIDGFREHGLVHISALAPQRVEAVEDVAKVGDEVWVKISAEAGRVSCSMKAVDQRSGADLGLGGGGGGGGNSGAAAARGGGGGPERDDLRQAAAARIRSGRADEPDAPKQKANFATSGKLAEDANKVNGVVLKFSEPADAAKPSSTGGSTSSRGRRRSSHTTSTGRAPTCSGASDASPTFRSTTRRARRSTPSSSSA